MTITDTVKQKKPNHKLLEKYTVKERTRKQKADIFMGIVFQIYLCIPWININILEKSYMAATVFKNGSINLLAGYNCNASCAMFRIV